MHSPHPTSAALLQTAVSLLNEHSPEDITVEMVLSTSGVSKGSLYHHYKDFAELLDLAQVARFSHQVDLSIAALALVVTESTSQQECFTRLVDATRATQARANAPLRAIRISTLAQANLRESMRAALGAEQQRLTAAIADLVREVQEKNWFRRDIDPYAVAVLIQAYTLGRAVDDVALEHVDEAKWDYLINSLVAQVFMGDATLVDVAGL